MKNIESMTPKIQLRAYSTKEVAVLYEVSVKTLRTWLIPFQKEIGDKNGRYYTPKQVKIIFQSLGLPEFLCLN